MVCQGKIVEAAEAVGHMRDIEVGELVVVVGVEEEEAEWERMGSS